jgi:hypothetical protein
MTELNEGNKEYEEAVKRVCRSIDQMWALRRSVKDVLFPFDRSD